MSDINDTASFPIGIPQQDNDATLPAPDTELLIITGMSGAGRSRAAATLEDLDWYVVDNLPPDYFAPWQDYSRLKEECVASPSSSTCVPVSSPN